MIIASSLRLEVGKIYTHNDLMMPFSYNDEYHYEYRFLVLKNATLHEYIAEIRGLGYTDEEINEYISTRDHYYDVSTD